MLGRLKRIGSVLGALGFVAVVFGWFPRHTFHPLREWDLRLPAHEERDLDVGLRDGTEVVVNGWMHLAWPASYADYGDIAALDHAGAEVRTFERGSGPFTVTGPVARLRITARGAPVRLTVRVWRAEAAEDLLWSERTCTALLLALLIPFLAVVVRPLSRWVDRDRSSRHLRRRIGWIGVAIVGFPILYHILSATLTRIEYRYALPGAVSWFGFLGTSAGLWSSAAVVIAFAALERRAIGGRLLELRASFRGALAGALIVAAGWLAWRLLPGPRGGAWWRLDSTAGFPAGVLLALSAGICEDFVYRGFLLTRLRELTESPVVALIVTSVAFGLVHMYDSGWHAFEAGVAGLLAGIVTLRTRNLYPAILAHAAWNLLCTVGMGYDVVRGLT